MADRFYREQPQIPEKCTGSYNFKNDVGQSTRPIGHVDDTVRRLDFIRSSIVGASDELQAMCDRLLGAEPTEVAHPPEQSVPGGLFGNIAHSLSEIDQELNRLCYLVQRTKSI